MVRLFWRIMDLCLVASLLLFLYVIVKERGNLASYFPVDPATGHFPPCCVLHPDK